MKHSRYKKNGYHTTTDGYFSTNKPPMGYNYALGYSEQSTEEVITNNTRKRVFMDNSKVVQMSQVRSVSK